MTNSKSTKGALLVSSVSLLLCFAMLLGTTFAWFTDSATSANNVIKAGNLDIDVQYTLDGENWAALDGANDLFQKGLWEPGHTEVVALKITNKGSLALKYTANMNIVDEKVGKTKDGKDIVLSDILTVSTLNQQVSQVGDIALMLAFDGENKVAYQNTTTFKTGNVLGSDVELHPNDAHYLFVKVDMAETVGNEANHNGTDIPTINFGINVLATQFTYEEDSFGSDYDKDAVVADVYVATEADLLDALKNAGEGEVIGLTSDIQMPAAAGSNGYGATGISITNGQTFDGGNNTFGVQAYGTWDSAINITGGTIKNITINKGFRGIFINHNSTYKAPVILENVIVNGPTYTISCDQGTNSGLKAFNSKFYGWTSYAATIGNVEFTNCTFGAGAGYNYSRPYAPTTYVNCKFEKGHVIDARAAVTFENCTIDGVELTDANIAELVGNNANVTVK